MHLEAQPTPSKTDSLFCVGTEIGHPISRAWVYAPEYGTRVIREAVMKERMVTDNSREKLNVPNEDNWPKDWKDLES